MRFATRCVLSSPEAGATGSQARADHTRLTVPPMGKRNSSGFVSGTGAQVILSEWAGTMSSGTAVLPD